jgi:general secretion pathway protein D
MAFMRQLSAVTTLNVVSSPYIMALDNQEAIINITEQYPIRKINYVTSSAGGVYPEESYDYKEVGLKLNVTPQINESNLVTLELKQEVSEFAKKDEITGQGVYKKREATSKVVVRDGQTVVIGGLIQKKMGTTKSGIPFFSDIPVIGRLFGSSGDTIQKTELLLFMTPHVITTQEETEKLTSEFENKVESLKELLEDFTEEQK